MPTKQFGKLFGRSMRGTFHTRKARNVSKAKVQRKPTAKPRQPKGSAAEPDVVVVELTTSVEVEGLEKREATSTEADTSETKGTHMHHQEDIYECLTGLAVGLTSQYELCPDCQSVLATALRDAKRDDCAALASRGRPCLDAAAHGALTIAGMCPPCSLAFMRALDRASGLRLSWSALWRYRAGLPEQPTKQETGPRHAVPRQGLLRRKGGQR